MGFSGYKLAVTQKTYIKIIRLPINKEVKIKNISKYIREFVKYE